MVFVLGVCIGGAAAGLLERARASERQQKLTEAAAAHGALVQQLVDRSLSATYAMAAVLQQNPTDLASLERLSRKLLPLYTGVDNLQLSPGGVVRHVFPATANQGPIGHDLLLDPLSRDEARLTVETRDLHIAIPTKLRQGKPGFVGRYPVFMADSQGTPRFWGFVSAVVLLDTIVAFGQFDRLDQRELAYQLWRSNPITGQPETLVRSAAPLTEVMVSTSIGVPRGSWQLTVSPVTPDSFFNSTHLAELLIVALIAAAAAAVTRSMLMRPVELAQMVRRRTRSLRNANAHLRQKATHDSLTGLGNRALLEHDLNQAIEDAQRNMGKFAVLLLDLDDFKSINDSLGHRAGDAMLKVVAGYLNRCVGPEDAIYRLGGDEFVIVLKRIGDAGAASAVAGKILAEVARPHLVQGRETHLTTSLGVVLYPQDASDAESLLSLADVAMYRAKKSGRNQVAFFSAALDHAAQTRLELVDQLRKAIRVEAFELHYQIKADIASGRPVGAEALLRWRHPVRGQVPPAEFIPLAEESGLIVPIGEWALRTACMEAMAWNRHLGTSLTIAVNLSAKQFQDEALLEKVRMALAHSGLPAHLLELEITESMMMHKPDEAAATMRALRQLGVHLAVDDFGTGYSSLGYLSRFPIHCLKIDRSFVQNVPACEADATIARSIVSLGKSLGLAVVAEGVETREQLDFLRQHGCDIAQGYLLGRPQAAAEFVAQLRTMDMAGAKHCETIRE
ncbi:EAL domain-containing protein [Herbaspirillum sp.]|uniref:putative bifunctional diguanylate cyclase/phosphodiesterase n=1 Tax=Herbaspirillum sp. TaxID=1890675 RepID=UPI0031D59768